MGRQKENHEVLDGYSRDMGCGKGGVRTRLLVEEDIEATSYDW